MKEGGWALVVLGLLLLCGALLVDVSVDVGYVPTDLGLPRMPREVANLHAMHIQALLLQAGFAAIICGVVLIGFGTIADVLREGREPQAEKAVRLAETSVVNTPDDPVEQDAPPGNDGDKWIVGILILVVFIGFLWLIAGLRGDGATIPSSNTAATLNELNEAMDNLEHAAENLDNEVGR